MRCGPGCGSGAGTSAGIDAIEARKRSRSRANSAGSSRSKTADMKFSVDAPLFEAADQVGDRDIELGGVDDGCVEQQRADRAAYDGWPARSPCPAASRTRCRRWLRAGSPVATPGRCRRGCGRPRRSRTFCTRSGRARSRAQPCSRYQSLPWSARSRDPSRGRGVDVFHREVRAFDDAHLDWGSTALRCGWRTILAA